MMALESSVLGCGSDDWSVDSDYAFQDFADDVKQHQQQHHQKSEQFPQSSAPTPERSDPPNLGTPSTAGAVTNPENDPNTGRKSLLHVRPDAAAAEGAGATATLAGGEGAVSGGVLLPEKGASARDENSEYLTMGSGRDDPQHPWMSKARLFGDPGSSTDSAHILRLEQRMFLKVG